MHYAITKFELAGSNCTCRSIQNKRHSILRDIDKTHSNNCFFFLARFTCNPDHYTHTSIIAKTLSLYLSLLEESYVKKLSACIKSDCSHWLSKLFG